MSAAVSPQAISKLAARATRPGAGARRNAQASSAQTTTALAERAAAVPPRRGKPSMRGKSFFFTAD
jgi:hypothetical protein